MLTCADADIELQWLRGYYIVDNNPYGASIFSKICKASAEGKKTFPFTTGNANMTFWITVTSAPLSPMWLRGLRVTVYITSRLDIQKSLPIALSVSF